MNDNDDCYCNECQLLSRAIRKMGNLFSRSVRISTLGEVNSNKRQFGITINLSPFKNMNKKRWFTYSHDKQRDILGRVEAKFRQLTPSIKLIKLVYEIAPAINNCDKFRNIHIHALYECPENFQAEMETYYNRVCKDPTNNWKHLDIKPIYDEEGWIKYISKDIDK